MFKFTYGVVTIKMILCSKYTYWAYYTLIIFYGLNVSCFAAIYYLYLSKYFSGYWEKQHVFNVSVKLSNYNGNYSGVSNTSLFVFGRWWINDISFIFFKHFPPRVDHYV